MNPIKLKDIGKQAFGRGWIFRCNKAEYPYESRVDFMLREDQNSPSKYSLIVISGSKAGCTLVQLPEDSIILNLGIGKQWLIDNWEKWVYPDGPVELIDVFRHEI